MSTSNSPVAKLREEAKRIAENLKAAESGKIADIGGKLAAARKAGSMKVGIVMDDKVITLDLPMATIRDTGEVALTEMIFKFMRGHQEKEH